MGSQKELNTPKKIPQNVSQADKLVKLAEQYKVFHDDTKEAFAYIENVAVPIRGREFKQLLARCLWKAERKAPSNEARSFSLRIGRFVPYKRLTEASEFNPTINRSPRFFA